jgi:hypothetical protein
MTPQKDKAFAFKALHDRPGMFVLPNPWDVGSARILAGLARSKAWWLAPVASKTRRATGRLPIPSRISRKPAASFIN